TREQGHCRCVRHLALEPGIDLGLIFHIPARKKCGECEFRINDQVCASGLGLVHQSEHALDDDFPAIGTLDRPHLSGRDIDDSHSDLPGYFNLKLDWTKKEQFERVAPPQSIAHLRSVLEL